MGDTYNINGGTVLIAPNATTATQNIGVTADSAKQKKKDSDEATVRKLMRYMNADLMDAYFRIGPARVKGKVFDIHDAWDGIIHASTFCIYDKKLRDTILKFYFAWDKIIQKGIPYYSPSRTPGDFVYGQAEFDMFDSPEQEQCFNEIMQKWYGTALQFRDMMECIKHKYIIDWEDVVIK